MSNEKEKCHLEHTYQLAKEKLLQKSYEQVCLVSGSSYNYNEKVYYLPYLNTTAKVNHMGEIDTEGKQLSLQEKILILHYLASDGGFNKKDNNYISFKELPGGEMYLVPFTNRTVKPFLNIFAGNGDKLSIVAEKWGGSLESFGDKSISLTVFPKVKICYVLWLGDEEFPANATVLFNNNIIGYLSTEDVVVLASQLVYQMPGLV